MGYMVDLLEKGSKLDAGEVNTSSEAKLKTQIGYMINLLEVKNQDLAKVKEEASK